MNMEMGNILVLRKRYMLLELMVLGNNLHYRMRENILLRYKLVHFVKNKQKNMKTMVQEQCQW
jgi:hypothetical protein